MLMINVVTSFRRLRRLMEVTVLCGTVLAFGTLVQFAARREPRGGLPGPGLVGGIFGNPNDLALALNILLPIALGLAMTGPNSSVQLLYWGCAGCLGWPLSPPTRGRAS